MSINTFTCPCGETFTSDHREGIQRCPKCQQTLFVWDQYDSIEHVDAVTPIEVDLSKYVYAPREVQP